MNPPPFAAFSLDKISAFINSRPPDSQVIILLLPQKPIECWNYGIKSVKRSLVSSGLLYLLFSNFVREVKIDIEKKDANNLLRTIKYIHSNIDKDINVSKLAEMSFLSKGHFTRRFHHLTHMTPLEYVNKQRIEKAQMLLNTTSYSCIEIAKFCGFKSNGYFSKVFKNQIGQTPVEYRKNKV